MIRQDEWLAGMGAVFADRSRSAMLLRLMDGRAYTAGELARAASIAAPTASHHLERLEASGLIACLRQGRHRYFRITNGHVAGMIEQMLAMHVGLTVCDVASSCPASLRKARRCYDHLAGEIGVRLLSLGLTRGVFAVNDADVVAGPAATSFLAALNIPQDAHGRFCLDWSERRFHLAGPLAAGVLNGMLKERWLLAGEDRGLVLTEKGRKEFVRWLGG